MSQPKRPELAERLTRFWWGVLPAAAYRLSPQLGTCLTDGIHLARWPALTAAGPPVALLIGLLLGWRHPGFPLIWAQSIPFLALLAFVGQLSASLGTFLVVGFAAGDFLLADHRWPPIIPPGAPGVLGAEFPASLRLRLPLLIGYLLLFLLAARIPVLTKTLLTGLVRLWSGSRLSSPAGTLVLTLIAHAVVTGALVWAWVQAAPVLIRPRFTLLGALAPPPEVLTPLQEQGSIVIAVAVAASLARMANQFPLASKPDVQAEFDRIQEPVLRVARRLRQPSLARLWIRAVGTGLLTTVVALGILANWPEAIVLLLASAALSTARSGLIRIPLGSWPELMERLPLAVRLVVGWIAIQFLAAQLLSISLFTGGSQDLFRPFVIATLLALVILYLLAPYPGATRQGEQPATLQDQGSST